MVTKRYLDSKLVEPIRERLREEGRKLGREEGRKEGREERIEEGKAIGEKREHQRWVAWNHRRLEAEAKGETFTEPPPGSGSANVKS